MFGLPLPGRRGGTPARRAPQRSAADGGRDARKSGYHAGARITADELNVTSIFLQYVEHRTGAEAPDGLRDGVIGLDWTLPTSPQRLETVRELIKLN